MVTVSVKGLKPNQTSPTGRTNRNTGMWFKNRQCCF